ncbi:N-terminal EF-hand calcium-binding protein 1-like isoform X3 [Arapaima gigas]
MMSCAEMITMCLQSAKQQHLFAKEPQTPQGSSLHSLSIFEDVSKKSQLYDGKLSFEEFKACFADGIISTAELEKLYCSIDKQQTNNLDTGKLSRYFYEHLGAYLNVLSALEELNAAILKAMDQTKEEYQSSSMLGQFVTRFMVRETSSQLHSLQMSLQWAMDALEHQSRPESRETDLSGPGGTRRSGFQTLRQLCLAPAGFGSQKLFAGVLLQPENNYNSKSLSLLQAKMECQNVLLVQRQMSVVENGLAEFLKELEKYTCATSCHSLHASVQKQVEERRFTVYEFWRDRVAWTSYLQSSVSRTFQNSIIKLLEGPEQVSTILLPASWWIMKSN